MLLFSAQVLQLGIKKRVLTAGKVNFNQRTLKCEDGIAHKQLLQVWWYLPQTSFSHYLTMLKINSRRPFLCFWGPVKARPACLHCFSVHVSYESQHLFWSWYFSTMEEKNTMQEIMFCSFLVLSSANACFQPVKKQNWTSSKQILFHFQTFSLEKKPRLRPFEELCQKPTAQKFLLFSMHALIGKKNFSKKVLFTTSGDSP